MCNMGWCGERCGNVRFWNCVMESEKVQESKVIVGRPSQCIYRMIQGFLTHGIEPWFFIVYGIYPWLLTLLILGFFYPFWVNGGYVEINSELPCIFGGSNNGVLEKF